MLSFLGDYLHAKHVRHWMFPTRGIDGQRILQSDWTREHLSQFDSLCNIL